MDAREIRRGEFLISSDFSKLQFERIHRFLSEEAYWSKGIPRAVVEKAAENSICFGVYTHEHQIGFARVVTDTATFAWFSDVYIEKKYRGQGLSKSLIEFTLADPRLKNLRRLCLATKDAHSLYEKFGFEVTKTPSYWMEIKDNDIYLR
jgi:N-acetylglutamate synthase-like GNAT family acetyltransferase